MSYLFQMSNVADDRYYVNVSIVNNTTDPILCNFDQIYQQPLLQHPKDYYFSVNRFSIIGSGIPLMIMPIQPGQSQSDSNLTTLLITLSYNGTNYQQYVTYIPYNDLTVPSGPASNPTLNFSQLNSTYYFIYSIQQFIDMINDTFLSIFNDVTMANPGITQTEAPYLIFDPVTQLISLVVQYSYIQGSPIGISVNAALYRYLNGFCYFQITGSTNGMDYTFVLADNDNNAYAKPGAVIPTPPTDPDYLIFTQEYIQNYMMSSFQSLIITTNTIPLQAEILPLPSDAMISNPFNNNSFSIITDFVVDLNQLGDIRSIILYNPTVLRMINFLSDNPLKRLDFQVYFQDFLGNLYNLEILPGTSCSFKFGFYKRSTYLT